MTTIFDRDLERRPANHQPLTPITFLERAALTYPDRPAVVHGSIRRDYATFWAPVHYWDTDIR